VPQLVKADPPWTLSDLSAPRAVSAAFGLLWVRVVGRDLYAHAPSAAAITVPSAGRALRVGFTPGFAPGDHTGTDGVTFEVWANGERLYSRHVTLHDRLQREFVRVPARQTDDPQLSFVTTPGPHGDDRYDRAMWQNVEVALVTQ
jgi:hypothetical protein